ncbi:pectin lyase-like family protein [Tieghemostelium lacteum]|uniref:Pectin lyase-like family protein n=1 Tax=Tieghemostelium lacteum TaxID=361077 RepID=A0A152A782_TIELA|nr:pectin lyase-like family protein [Tieghemostelium lacteum]|eukprot:KYR01981.1 pectin lyase-like family protein [Tieghemostelium lacteum]
MKLNIICILYIIGVVLCEQQQLQNPQCLKYISNDGSGSIICGDNKNPCISIKSAINSCTSQNLTSNMFIRFLDSEYLLNSNDRFTLTEDTELTLEGSNGTVLNLKNLDGPFIKVNQKSVNIDIRDLTLAKMEKSGLIYIFVRNDDVEISMTNVNVLESFLQNIDMNLFTFNSTFNSRPIKLNIQSSNFNNNTCVKNLYSTTDSTSMFSLGNVEAVFKNTTFEFNSGYRSIIKIIGNSLSVFNSTFLSNEGPLSYGTMPACITHGNSQLTVDNVEFNGHFNYYFIYNIDRSPLICVGLIQNSRFLNNNSPNQGKMMSLQYCNWTLTNNLFSNNNLNEIIYNYQSVSMLISNSTFTENKGTTIIEFLYGPVTLSNIVITGNINYELMECSSNVTLDNVVSTNNNYGPLGEVVCSYGCNINNLDLNRLWTCTTDYSATTEPPATDDSNLGKGIAILVIILICAGVSLFLIILSIGIYCFIRSEKRKKYQSINNI